MLQSSHGHAPLNVSRGGQAYASDVSRRIAHLHQVLADIDFALAFEVERLKLREVDSEPARALIETLRKKHQLRREPFARRLADLSAHRAG